MENATAVTFFNLCGFEESWMNKSVYFPLTLVTYLLIITANLTLIIAIILEKSLHDPMYIFICNLSINSLYGTVGFYPMFLYELLRNVHVISYAACFTQGFFIYTSVLCDFTNLTVMSIDRYMAICRPLHYNIIMSPVKVRFLLFFTWLYPLLAIAIGVTLTLRLPLCGSNIHRVFCDNNSILKHSCVPITFNRIWSNILLAGQITLAIFTAYSYFQIIRVCFKSAEGRLKFTQTCVPHLLLMVVFIAVSLFDILYGWYDGNAPLHIRNAISMQFIVIPPFLNPIIYGLSLKQIRKVIAVRISGKRFI